MRWDPFREMAALRDAMDRFLGLPWAREWPLAAGSIPLDMYEEGDNLIVKASVPGVRPDDLNVQVRDDLLTISGEVKQETERKESDYHLRERRYGRFERTVALPSAVQVDKAEAEFENGLLTLRLPKAPGGTKLRRIKVKVKG
jgi:HSP20 family protein